MSRTRVVVTVVVWLVVWAALLVSDASPSAIALAGVAAVALAMTSVVIDAVQSAAHGPWRRPRPAPTAARDDDPRVVAFGRHLLAERSTESTEIDDRLRAQVEARLRTRFGVDLHADPVGAAAVLPPALQRLVAGTPYGARRRRSRLRELQQLLAELEAL
jgi:hypothetical protein